MNIFEFQKEMNAYMANREKLEVSAVYAQLKDTYNLVLTRTFALENGEEDYGEDFDILCGVSSAGQFQLYDNGLDIVFDVDKADGSYVHWHPADTQEAIDDICAFMQGQCKV